jgi:prepilin-type N-terminal cleavage/methylation domain-containing protein
MRSIRCNLRRGSRHAPHYRRRVVEVRAYTIIELVIVLLIMSIFAAVTAPSFMNSLLFHRVETAARRVKADIDYTRQRARLTSTPQSITFTTGATYTISGAKSLENINRAYTVNLKNSPYSLDSATANFSNMLVLTFDGYGTPTSGGTVVLAAKSHQCTVSVNSVTGVVTFSSNHTAGGTSQTNGG